MTGITGTLLKDPTLLLPSGSKFSHVFHLVEEKTAYDSTLINGFFQQEGCIGDGYIREGCVGNFSLKKWIEAIKKKGDHVFVTGEWIDHLFFGGGKPNHLEFTFQLSDPEAALHQVTFFMQVRDVVITPQRQGEISSFSFSFRQGEKTIEIRALIEKKKERVCSEASFETVALKVTDPFLMGTEEKMTVCSYGKEAFSADQGVVYTTIEKRKQNIIENFFIFDLATAKIEDLPSKLLETKHYAPDMLERFFKTLGGPLHLKVFSDPKIINVFINYVQKHFTTKPLFEKLQCIFQIVFFLELGKVSPLIPLFLDQVVGQIRKNLRGENRDVLSKSLNVLHNLSAKEISSTVLLQKWQKILQFLALYTLQTNSSVNGLNIELKLIGKRQFAFLSLELGEGFHINLPDSSELSDVSEEDVFNCFPLENFTFESVSIEQRKGGRVFFGKTHVEKSLTKIPSLSTLATFMTTTTFNENNLLHRNILFSFLHHYLFLIENQPYKGLFEQLIEWSGSSFKEYRQDRFALFRAIYEDKDLLKYMLETTGKSFFTAYFPASPQIQESEKKEIEAFFKNGEISLDVKRLFATSIFPPYVDQNKENRDFLRPFVELLITKDSMPLSGYQLHALSGFHDEINRRQLALFPKTKTKEEVFQGTKQTEEYRKLEKNLKGKKETLQLTEILKSFNNLNKQEKGVIFELMVTLLLRMPSAPQAILKDFLKKSTTYWDSNPLYKGIFLVFCYTSTEMRKAYEEHLKEASSSVFKLYFYPETEVEKALSLDVSAENKQKLKERIASFAGAFCEYLLELQYPHNDLQVVRKAIHFFIEKGCFEEVVKLLSKYEKTSLCLNIEETLAPLKGKWGSTPINSSNAPSLKIIFSLVWDQGEMTLILEEIFTSKISKQEASVVLELLTPFCRTREQKEKLLMLVIRPLTHLNKEDLKTCKELLGKIFSTRLGENEEEFFAALFTKFPLETRSVFFNGVYKKLSDQAVDGYLKELARGNLPDKLVETTFFLQKNHFFPLIQSITEIFLSPENSMELKEKVLVALLKLAAEGSGIGDIIPELELGFRSLPFEMQVRVFPLISVDFSPKVLLPFLEELNNSNKGEAIVNFFDKIPHHLLPLFTETIQKILKNQNFSLALRRKLFGIFVEQIGNLDQSQTLDLSLILENFFRSEENKKDWKDIEFIDWESLLKNLFTRFSSAGIQELLRSDSIPENIQHTCFCLFHNVLSPSLKLSFFYTLPGTFVFDGDFYEDLWDEMCSQEKNEEEWNLFFKRIDEVYSRLSGLIVRAKDNEELLLDYQRIKQKITQLNLKKIVLGYYNQKSENGDIISLVSKNPLTLEIHKRKIDRLLLSLITENNDPEYFENIYLEKDLLPYLIQCTKGLNFARQGINNLLSAIESSPCAYDNVVFFLNLLIHFKYLYLQKDSLSETLTIEDFYNLIKVLQDPMIFENMGLDFYAKDQKIFASIFREFIMATPPGSLNPKYLPIAFLVCSEEEYTRAANKSFSYNQFWFSITEKQGISSFIFSLFIEKIKNKEDAFRKAFMSSLNENEGLAVIGYISIFQGFSSHLKNLVYRGGGSKELVLTGRDLEEIALEMGVPRFTRQSQDILNLGQLVAAATNPSSPLDSIQFKEKLKNIVLKEIDSSPLSLENLNFFIYSLRNTGPFSLEVHKENVYPLLSVVLKNVIKGIIPGKENIFFCEKGFMVQSLLLNFFEVIITPLAISNRKLSLQEIQILKYFSTFYALLFQCFKETKYFPKMEDEVLGGYFIGDFEKEYLEKNPLNLNDEVRNNFRERISLVKKGNDQAFTQGNFFLEIACLIAP